MSLQYIIDGYNVIRHSSFNPPKKIKDPRAALLEFIKINRPCGSLKNKVTIVFDGSADVLEIKQNSENVGIIFTRKETADDWIKRTLERTDNPKNTVVVSDDKEIVFFIKSCGAKAMGVEEFINIKKSPLAKKQELVKAELTYSQMHEINQELKKVWLKD